MIPIIGLPEVLEQYQVLHIFSAWFFFVVFVIFGVVYLFLMDDSLRHRDNHEKKYARAAFRAFVCAVLSFSFGLYFVVILCILLFYAVVSLLFTMISEMSKDND